MGIVTFTILKYAIKLILRCLSINALEQGWPFWEAVSYAPFLYPFFFSWVKSKTPRKNLCWNANVMLFFVDYLSPMRRGNPISIKRGGKHQKRLLRIYFKKQEYYKISYPSLDAVTNCWQIRFWSFVQGSRFCKMFKTNFNYKSSHIRSKNYIILSYSLFI